MTSSNIRLTELCLYVLVFLNYMKFKAFRVTHNETRKMVNFLDLYQQFVTFTRKFIRLSCPISLGVSAFVSKLPVIQPLIWRIFRRILLVP